MQVQADLSEDHSGFIIDSYVIVACFLVREGGDLHIKNNNGISPYQLCPSDIGTLISTFVEKHGWVSNLSLLSQHDLYISLLPGLPVQLFIIYSSYWSPVMMLVLYCQYIIRCYIIIMSWMNIWWHVDSGLGVVIFMAVYVHIVKAHLFQYTISKERYLTIILLHFAAVELFLFSHRI